MRGQLHHVVEQPVVRGNVVWIVDVEPPDACIGLLVVRGHVGVVVEDGMHGLQHRLRHIELVVVVAAVLRVVMVIAARKSRIRALKKGELWTRG